MKPLIAAVLFTIALPAYADTFFALVGYVCDKQNDQLLLTYDGAYNEEGEAMLMQKRSTQWDPWKLLTIGDDEFIHAIKTVRRQCRLSDGIYQIAITPSPGNVHIQRRCGAWITAGAIVKKGKKTIYAMPRFHRDCHDSDTPIVTRVKIKPGAEQVEVSTVAVDEFYK